MAAQTITDCRNFTLDFKQHGFCASPLFLQTLGPWFPNEIQNVLSSEKRTLDEWATVQFFFSLAQVRCFWRCFCFRSSLVAHFPKMSEHGDSWFTFTFIHLVDTFIQSYLQLRNAISDTLYRDCSEQILARQWGVKGKRAKLRKDASVILLLQWLSKPLGSTVWSLLQWLSKPLGRAVYSLLQLLSQPLGGATCCELFRTLYCSSS